MARKIVVCCDGTWNKPRDGTNIHRTYEHLRAQLRDASDPVRGLKGKIEGWRHCHGKASDGSDVLLYYDKGVGTGFGELVTGGALGRGLSDNVRDAYHYLAHHYQPGDEIYIFGFSRGAYTARSLCGFIDRAGGLLQKPSEGDVLRAYLHYYALADAVVGKPEGWSIDRAVNTMKAWLSDLLSRDIKNHPRHTDIKVRFVGVYDTVGALGIPVPKADKLNDTVVGFHNTGLSTRVEHSVHALAVDEKRGPYAPTLWTAASEHAALGPGQTCLQVWFPGVHSDIGGGYGDKGIGDITFDFMLRRAAECGLVIDQTEPLPRLELRELPSQHDSMDGLWDKVGRLFSSFEQERPVGPTARARALESGAKAAGCEMLHPSLVQRLDEQVEIVTEKDDGLQRRSTTYSPGNIPWSAMDIREGRAELPLFHERAELRRVVDESATVEDTPCTVVDRSKQGVRIEMANPPAQGATVTIGGKSATVAWIEGNQAGLRFAA